MAYTLGQASKATGKSKTAIAQALAEGRLSGGKDEQGRWQIDPAELHRVYPKHDGQVDEREHQPDTDRTAEIELLRERLADKDAVIDDLRKRLDREGEERRRLTAILTDQREQPRRRWWSFGKRESA
jgi:hypothetical protein